MTKEWNASGEAPGEINLIKRKCVSKKEWKDIREAPEAVGK